LLTDGGGNTTGAIAFSTRNATGDTALTERMRLDSSGNLGLGVTPSAWEGGYKAIQVNSQGSVSATSSAVYLSNNFYQDAGGTNRYIATGAGGIAGWEANIFRWYQAASGSAGATQTTTNSMTLDASGNLLVGTTSGSARLNLTKDSGDLIVVTTSGGGTGYVYVSGTTTGNAGYFQTSSGLAGSIQCSGTSTSYVTSSDYRLKQDIAPMTDALAKVAALKPVTYKWKADGSDGEGFIAHELAAVVPQCVTGEKDAVDAEGKPVYQGIDTSFLVATLTAAIQELKAEVDSLKSQLKGA